MVGPILPDQSLIIIAKKLRLFRQFGVLEPCSSGSMSDWLCLLKQIWMEKWMFVIAYNIFVEMAS